MYLLFKWREKHKQTRANHSEVIRAGNGFTATSAARLQNRMYIILLYWPLNSKSTLAYTPSMFGDVTAGVGLKLLKSLKSRCREMKINQ